MKTLVFIAAWIVTILINSQSQAQSATTFTLTMERKLGRAASKAAIEGYAGLYAVTADPRWRIGEDIPAGRYWVEFSGNLVGATEWRDSFEHEPYRFLVQRAGEPSAQPVAHSFPVDGASIIEVEALRHRQLDVPEQVALRRSDRPIELRPGDILSMKAPWVRAVLGDLTLIPAQGPLAVEIITTPAARFGMFDPTIPLAFTST